MKTRRVVFETIAIVTGNVLLAAAVQFIIIPNDILTGGVAGIAVALSSLLQVDVKLLVSFLIAICFVLGLIFLGKKFAIKTLASSLLYPVLLNVFSVMDFKVVTEPILASLYGGLISGVGIGLVFRAGASTGGMDVPPLILAKYTKLKIHSWMLITDFLTVLLGISTMGLNAALIGLISVWSMTYMINAVQTLGGQQAKQVFIITNNTPEVLEMILTTLDRGATLIDATGGFTHDQRKIIMTVLMNDQYARLEKKVKEIDADAFLIVSDVTEVHGNGFYKA